MNAAVVPPKARCPRCAGSGSQYEFSTGTYGEHATCWVCGGTGIDPKYDEWEDRP